MASLTAIKRFHRYCAYRAYCFDLDSSGYYRRLDTLQKFCKQSGISYNTLRADLKTFIADGLLSSYGRHIRFRRLQGAEARMYAIYRNYQYEIEQHQDSAGYFAGLIHRQEMNQHFLRQAYKEAERIQDDSARKKYLRTVNRTHSHIGVNQGIICGIGTLARVFGKSRSTAWRYVVRAENKGIISVRRNFTFIGIAGTMAEYLSLRQQYKAYGRMVWRKSTGKVFVRELNDYTL